MGHKGLTWSPIIQDGMQVITGFTVNVNIFSIQILSAHFLPTREGQ